MCIYMKRIIADAVDTDFIYCKCSLPNIICPIKFHKYKSDGIWNPNRNLLTKSKCYLDYEDDIMIQIQKITLRESLISDKKPITFSKKLFRKKLKKFRNKNKKLGIKLKY